MACSKELRIPREWTKYHHNIVNEAVDPELFSEDEVIKLLDTIGMCHDQSTVKKYIASTRPYHMTRYFVPVIPNNAMCREIFKLWAHLTLTTFISDDMMETLSETEMHQLCDGFQVLDEQISEQFPRLPTLAEMKQSLSLKNVNEKVVPHILNMIGFSSSVAKCLLQHGNFLQDDVRDYWRRLVVYIALYFEGVKAEASCQNVIPRVEVSWRRVLSGAIMIWMSVVQPMSGSIGKVRAHLPLINELYSLGALFCMTINDIYSHEKEIVQGARVCNLVRTMTESKEVFEESEAAQKCVRIVNAIIKTMYQKIEKTKQENPDNPVLCRLLDNTGMAAAGQYFSHQYTPRYDDTQWRLPLVDVEEEKLKEWRKGHDEEQPDEVKHLLQHCSPKAKKISDYIISGVVNMHATLLPA